MNKLGSVVKRILIRTCSEIARLVEPVVLLVINESQYADIELSSVVQQRSLYVLLDHHQVVVLFAMDEIDDFGELRCYLDALASVEVLRLDYPHVLFELL